MESKSRCLEGKRILITGADQGIGAALAVHFSRLGATLCLNRFHSTESSDGLLAQLKQSGLAPLSIHADVRVPSQIDALFQEVAEKLGGLDALVNNAGVDSTCAALDLPVEEWDRILNTNLRGAFFCAQGAARIMKEQQSGGVILNISSIHDSVPRLGTAHYCASKAGMTMLTRALAREWAEYKVRVVGIAPGAIETDINKAEIAKVGRSRFEGWIPLGRLGNTDDICDAAAFLISEQASYVSGATLVVDGAYSLNGIHYDPRSDTGQE